MVTASRGPGRILATNRTLWVGQRVPGAVFGIFQFRLLDRAPYTSIFLSEDTSSSLSYLQIFIALKVSENMDSCFALSHK